jgi:hypothetical protein
MCLLGRVFITQSIEENVSSSEFYFYNYVYNYFPVFVPVRDRVGTKTEKVGLYQHVTVRVQKLKKIVIILVEINSVVDTFSEIDCITYPMIILLQQKTFQ